MTVWRSTFKGNTEQADEGLFHEALPIVPNMSTATTVISFCSSIHVNEIALLCDLGRRRGSTEIMNDLDRHMDKLLIR